VLGEEALSAGAWYVAIDLQLYALFALMMALAARSNARGIAQALVVTATVASLLAFNRDPAWDVWAPYYFGSYGLGVLAAWSAQAPRPRVAAIAIAVLGALALWVEFRSRIALATTVALLLAWTDVNGLLRRWPDSRLLGWLGRISFSVFLIHYPVVVLFDAIAARWLGGQPLVEALTLGLAFISCTAAGALFHRYVETPLAPRPAPRRAPLPEDPHDAGEPTRPKEVPRG
jgi:peptidoglycan/LPS O-acetylase OafA/YrhL